MQEAARSRYNDVLDFDSSSAILKIEWREEDLGFTAHVQPFLSPVAVVVVFQRNPVFFCPFFFLVLSVLCFRDSHWDSNIKCQRTGKICSL